MPSSTSVLFNLSDEVRITDENLSRLPTSISVAQGMEKQLGFGDLLF